MKNPLKLLNKFDIALWCVSVTAVILSFALSSRRDVMSLVSALVGVSALMFIVKGHVLGQILTVIFAAGYGVVSYFFKYYGEMITYLGMSAPAAIAAIISWLRHPYKQSSQVAVGTLNIKKAVIVVVLSSAVTAAFYFILKALGTNNLTVSTVSVATSMFASALVFLRSPFYGVAYAANDVVLIVMWVLASIADISYLPMVICFSLFFIYDIYGFISWSKMKRAQSPAEANSSTEAPETDTIETE